jgi:predicted transposase/invertase (TIGR01784 family)
MAQKFDEGKIEGEKIGLKKGEKTALLKVVKNMLKQGLEIQSIEKMTGLSKKEIESLKENSVHEVHPSP